jgi:hypothetical protein
MSIDYPRKRIRLKMEVSSAAAAIDAATGSGPFFWLGDDVQFDVVFQYNGSVIDVSKIQYLTMEVKAVNKKRELPVMFKRITGVEVNAALTDADVELGAAQHASLVFTNLETQLDLGGADNANYWFVVWALTNDDAPRKMVLGAGTLSVFDGGNDVAVGLLGGDGAPLLGGNDAPLTV